MAGILSRRWRIGGVLLGLALVAVALSAATAAASTTETGMQIGPLKVGDGYKLTITGQECNTTNAITSVTVEKTGSGYTLAHYYYAPKVRTTCTTSPKYGSGKMTVRWGKLTVRMKFSKAGRKRRRTEKGCTGSLGQLRHVTGKGTLKMDIHPGAFGKLDLHKVKGEILIYDGTGGSCGGGGSLTEMGAGFAKGKYSATGYTAGSRHFAAVYVPDNVSRKVRGSLDDVFRASNVFTFSSNLSKGKIGSFNPFLSGSLSYKASSPCVDGSTTGTMKGKLVLHDPVSGTFDLIGKDAYQGYHPYLYNTSGAC